MIIAFILLFVIYHKLIADRTEAYIHAITTWTLLLFIMTEILSVFHGISFLSLWTCWILIDVTLFAVILKHKKQYVLRNFFRGLKEYFKLEVIFFILLAAGMIFLALKMIPYNWDSMTYHLARLFHWEQNGSIAHYATTIDRQVASPVLGAFVNLHVYTMSGRSDKLLNLLQCFSYLTNGVLIYSLSAKLKCKRNFCIFSAVLFYTMPIAFAEALTTQVDHFAALWVISFTYLLLHPWLDTKLVFNKDMVLKAGVISLCIAFGYLAKPSVGVGMVVFAIWLLLVLIARKDQIVIVMRYICLAGAIIALTLVPELIRNIFTFHAMSAPVAGARQLMSSPHPKHIFVNFLKNFTFNFSVQGMPQISDKIKEICERIAYGLEIDINNPAISEDGREFTVMHSYTCDRAVNPVIMYLLVFVIIVMIVRIKKVDWRDIRTGFSISAIIAFLAFCVVLKWEAFVSRYMLSYLAVLCPVIAVQLEESFGGDKKRKYKIACETVVYVLCAMELFNLVKFHGSMALGYSRNGYFASRKWEAEPYREIAEYINNNDFQEIGLHLEKNMYEFPLTLMIDNYSRIEHVNVDNNTQIYEDESFVPEVILALGVEIGDTMECHGYLYKVVLEAGEDLNNYVLLKAGKIEQR